ncbi:MAG TPA: tRNA glutamyl-Q(34) synthetase GluQRS [Betaproteobacteria bacterium]|nr:tRNA glutamyl-Q(34) synthetase GluQRS [Betaproteobacteria bacterium]
MYVGRFAPTPSGSLHFGSVVTAIGSYCDAKFNDGRWIIRIDDLDEERNIDGADTDILRTLESLGLHWDAQPIYQSRQKKYYGEWLHALSRKDDVYPCSCSRKTLREHSVFKDGDWIYSGHCKFHFTENQTIRNHRFNLRQPCTITINDIGQGLIAEDLYVTSGDFVVFKADGTPSYHLASVLDDHRLGITHVVRGRDLLRSSLRQAELQRALGQMTPSFLHLPLVKNEAGQKLSKQNKAGPINAKAPKKVLIDALRFLHQNLPPELLSSSIEEILIWASKHWDTSTINSRQADN